MEKKSVPSSPQKPYLCSGAASDIWMVDKVETSDRIQYVRKEIRVAKDDFQNDKQDVWESFISDLVHKVDTWTPLSHSHIVRMKPSPLSDTCFLTEYCPGGDLRNYVKGGISGSIAYSLIRDIICGLDYLHGQNPVIVHGNINAGKIFLDANQTVKIGEFGLALLTIEFPNLVPAVSHQNLVRWFSPERFGVDIEHSEATTYSDIWAFGCTMLEIITSKLPYSQYKYDAKVTQRILSGERPGKRHKIQENQEPYVEWSTIWDLIDQCWSAIPNLRPSARALVNQFPHDPPLLLKPDYHSPPASEVIRPRGRPVPKYVRLLIG